MLRSQANDPTTRTSRISGALRRENERDEGGKDERDDMACTVARSPPDSAD